MTHCPTCGRRHRRRREKTLAPMPLFEWQPAATPTPAAPAMPSGRVVLLHGCLNPDGEPRGGIVRPDGTTLAFYDLAAAAAALRNMEVRA